MSITGPAANKLLACNKARLTYDAIEYLLTYINIGYLDIAIECLGAHLDDGEKEKLKYRREDVRPVFNDLTYNSEEL